MNKICFCIDIFLIPKNSETFDNDVYSSKNQDLIFGVRKTMLKHGNTTSHSSRGINRKSAVSALDHPVSMHPEISMPLHGRQRAVHQSARSDEPPFSGSGSALTNLVKIQEALPFRSHAEARSVLWR